MAAPIIGSWFCSIFVVFAESLTNIFTTIVSVSYSWSRICAVHLVLATFCACVYVFGLYLCFVYISHGAIHTASGIITPCHPLGLFPHPCQTSTDILPSSTNAWDCFFS
jgi:hypothetical protein